MRIVTWNVNSIRKREEIVLAWLEKHKPDALLLQETKVTDDKFPKDNFEKAGYQLEIHGQPGLNGVAILSPHKIEDAKRGLDGEASDEQARYIEATIKDVRIASVYVPNGTSIGSDKFDYKMRFFKRLGNRIDDLLKSEKPFIIGGDYNVAPDPIDVYDPNDCKGDICYHDDERKAFRTLIAKGVYDGFRCVHAKKRQFTWWDLRRGSYDRDEGMRIDHLLLSPEAVDRLKDSAADASTRAGKGISDHVPIWVDIE